MREFERFVRICVFNFLALLNFLVEQAFYHCRQCPWPVSWTLLLKAFPPVKTSKAKNFIDGDLIESFLLLEQSDMDKVVAGVEGSNLDDITKLIEELTQLH